MSNQSTAGEKRQAPYMDYRTWDGTKWRAWRLNKTEFKHALGGDETKAHSDTIINYMTWGYSLWTAKWNGNEFIHTPAGGGPSHGDSVLNYIGWQDPPHVEWWQCRYDGRQFLHERFVPNLDLLDAAIGEFSLGFRKR